MAEKLLPGMLCSAINKPNHPDLIIAVSMFGNKSLCLLSFVCTSYKESSSDCT